jgi:hypothetical protein
VVLAASRNGRRQAPAASAAYWQSDRRHVAHAELLRARNAIDAEIASIIGRPMTSGHLGEWIAARIFDIELEPSATATATDGRFSSGSWQGGLSTASGT